MITLLDIGAGCTNFARQFIARNKHLGDIRALCAEPGWCDMYRPNMGTGLWRRVYKIHSSYGELVLPDRSVDVLTLNAFHPLAPPGRGFPHEVARVLKPRGVFISVHPIAVHPDMSTAGLCRYENGERSLRFTAESDSTHAQFACCVTETALGTLYVPASPTIINRLQVVRGRLPKSHGYIYSNTSRSPTLELWQHPLQK